MTIKSPAPKILLITLLIAAWGLAAIASTQPDIVQGHGNIANYEISRLPKREAHELKIIKLDGQYTWASNGNKLLIRTDRKIPGPYKVGSTYSFYVNPEGYGLVMIRHDDLPADALISSDQRVPNYFEYRIRDDGVMIPYSGYTDPYPYPPTGFIDKIIDSGILNFRN
ncbi:hypothetical protein NPS53_11695 [Pseudomonas putida]|uniref:hypothetical protein n=1 Tax=Pseudomonas putida TaxID=303 RepID=UPI0023638DE0|nr:hypothetical protein [Pseudomonas putida]MDD2140241.1 hypothetical protein [Pseudomonas putida]HDS1725587.1 hypothetical protein [Pseudomonas putida]